ncbi:MAG: oligomeric, coiled-coil, peripheral membrane protein [Lichina confinis]|nr:MAG: oligomeric, coiled-coil, peripheral membrane protein [Lichina confinis]
MGLDIYVAHSGARCQADNASFESVEALKSWIAQHTPVAPSNQILMNEAGRQVKLQTLLAEKELFVYDRQLISSLSTGSRTTMTDMPVPAQFSLKKPPDMLTSPSDLAAWRSLFKSRRSWAMHVIRDCSLMVESIRYRLDETNIIDRAVAVAVLNLRRHVSNLEQKHNDAQVWVHDIAAEQRPALVGWEGAMARLDRIPVRDDVLRAKLLKASNINIPGRKGKGGAAAAAAASSATLGTLLDAESTERAIGQARLALKDLDDKRNILDKAIGKVVASSHELVEKIRESDAQRQLPSEEEIERLMEDVEVVANTVSSDCDQVLTLPESSKSLSQASKRAMIHTQELLPSLGSNAGSLAKLERQATEDRNGTARSAALFLQKISVIESNLANVNQQLSTLEIGPEAASAFDLLGLVTRLPYIYGSMLIELYRRRLWHEKVKKESGALAEELASMKNEEVRRRRKWQRGLGEIVNLEATDDRTVSVEVNMRGEQTSWPVIGMQDIEEYVGLVKKMDDMDTTTEELSRLVGELGRPKRQRSRRLQAFKNESVHDAAMGRTSLLLRENDDLVRGLRDDKAKLEEKLKGSESRIRKLEDIVHRQSDMHRNASGNIFQLPNPQRSDARTTPPSTAHPFAVSSRPPDGPSRRSSVSSKRFSANRGDEEKALVQRMLSLEAELTTEREQVAGFQRDASLRKVEEDALKARVLEAESTKHDLMKNMEAQQREFSDERNHLEEEARELQGRLEEAEIAYGRMMESREQETGLTAVQVRAAEAQHAEVCERNAVEMERLQIESENARSLSTKHLERAGTAEKLAQAAVEEKNALEEKLNNLQGQLQESTQVQAEQVTSLRIVHERLLPEEAAPAKASELIDAVEVLIQRSADHLRDVETALSMAQAANETLRAKLDRADEQYDSMQEKLGTEEMESFALREKLAGESGKLAALKTELATERTEVEALRAQFADGEMGSDALKKRLADEEDTNAGLRAELAAMQAEMTVFDEELRSRKDTMGVIKASAAAGASQLSVRTDRAKDISQRLYAFVDRMSRLLETLGFTVSYQQGEMAIQRIPKSMSASGYIANEQSPHQTQDKKASRAVPTSNTRLVESWDLHSVHWMDAMHAEEESRLYSAYLDAVKKLDMEVVCEAIAKRMKETEVVAKRWQREARSWRDRAQRFQTEAHEKVACRSFREGDLALFCPTRNQATRPWAAFNIGAPHYFLREQETHKLGAKDFLLARITKIEERVVDLSRAINQAPPSGAADGHSIGESSDGGVSFDDENPFELPDGIRWYWLDAVEEKAGAPSTPGLGRSTVASANVDARGSVRVKKSALSGVVAQTLHKSLDSRRSSGNRRESGTGSNVGAASVTDTSSNRTSMIVVPDTATPTSPRLAIASVSSRPSSRNQQQQQPSAEHLAAKLKARQDQQQQPGAIAAGAETSRASSTNAVNNPDEAVYRDTDHDTSQLDNSTYQLLQQQSWRLREDTARNQGSPSTVAIADSEAFEVHSDADIIGCRTTATKASTLWLGFRSKFPETCTSSNVDAHLSTSTNTGVATAGAVTNRTGNALVEAKHFRIGNTGDTNRPRGFWDSLWFLDFTVERGQLGPR